MDAVKYRAHVKKMWIGLILSHTNDLQQLPISQTDLFSSLMSPSEKYVEKCRLTHVTHLHCCFFFCLFPGRCRFIYGIGRE